MDRNSRPATQPTAKNGKSSPFRGVTLFRPTGKWRAQISTGGKTMSLGDHNTEQEAARAFDRALIHKDGPCARTNFPIQDYEPEIAYLQGVSMEQLIADLRMMARRSGRSCQAHRKRSVRAPPPTDGRQEKRREADARDADPLAAERLLWDPRYADPGLVFRHAMADALGPNAGLALAYALQHYGHALSLPPALESPWLREPLCPDPSPRTECAAGCFAPPVRPVARKGAFAGPSAQELHAAAKGGVCVSAERGRSPTPPTTPDATTEAAATAFAAVCPDRPLALVRAALTAGAKNRRCLKAPSRAPCT
uniref:AP2/ERF domain-containing protein n=1 Tax=Tetraselmis sp. GSL018 TaxID=582737 RepID=A0A061S550_9CHLO